MNQLAPWNDERVEIISQQWREGRSAGQIARSLGGTSRSAVIGKLHRLGLLGRARPTPPGKPKGGRPKGSSRVPS